jgi:hypothetical protein
MVSIYVASSVQDSVIGRTQEAGGRHSTLAASGQTGQDAVQPVEQVSGRQAPPYHFHNSAPYSFVVCSGDLPSFNG